MKLFKTTDITNIETVKCCQNKFRFELPKCSFKQPRTVRSITQFVDTF